jgi:hypothetical protein
VPEASIHKDADMLCTENKVRTTEQQQSTAPTGDAMLFENTD